MPNQSLHLFTPPGLPAGKPFHPAASFKRTLNLPIATLSLASLILLGNTFMPLLAQTLSQNALPGQTLPAPASAPPSLDPLSHPTIQTSPLVQPGLTPGVLFLMELEGRFAQAVAAGGGKAFATWFADDAVTLNNGRPAVLGRASIAAEANWDPKVYQLTWSPQGAQMGPSNDTGFTWGHYEGRTTDRNHQPVVTSGRYITVWKKLPDGTWKVALDASSNEPPAAQECCSLPKP